MQEKVNIKGSVYSEDVKIGKKNFKTVTIFTSLLAVMIVFFGTFFILPSNVKISFGDAFAFFCNDKTLGHNMKATPDLRALSVVPFMDATGRTWTLEEAYGKSTSFVNYYGETGENPTMLVFDTTDLKGRSFGVSDEVYKALEANKGKLENERTLSACTLDNIPLFIASFLYMIASAIMNLVSIFVTFAFDSSFICKDATQKNCVDFVGIIGGKPNSSSGGIIGALTSNIYLPLAAIAITIAAFTILYQAFFKRQFRQAFGYLAWIILAFILGLMALFNPNLLAKFPMTAANSIAGCVIGAFNGESCLTSSSTNAKIDIADSQNLENTSGAACSSNAEGNLAASDILSMAINGMSCSIWKSFILQSQTAAEFGVPFEELDVTSETVKPMLDKAGLDGNMFCVGRYTKESFSQVQSDRKQNDAPLTFSDKGTKVCNLAAYQKYLQTNAISTNLGDTKEKIRAPRDARWYNLIAVLVQNDDIWNTWNPDLAGGISRVLGGFTAIVSAIAGGIVLVTISVYAMVYYISAVLLMALAPLFLLFALQPTKGKKMFLGWVEQIVSSLLKYLASAFFLIISLAFYSAVFGGLTNPFVTLIFIIILSIALFMYRKEIVDMIGRVNMGGEQFSNKFANMGQGVKKVGRGAKNAIGSGIGAAVSDKNIRSFARGAGSGIKRELAKGSGIVANAAKQHNRDSSRATSGFKKEMNKRAKEEKTLVSTEKAAEINVANKKAAAATKESEVVARNKALDIKVEQKKADAEKKMVIQLEADLKSGKLAGDVNATNFAKFMSESNKLKDLGAQRAAAAAAGDSGRVAALDKDISWAAARADAARNAINDKDFAAMNANFNTSVSNEVSAEIATDVSIQADITARDNAAADYNKIQRELQSAEKDRITASANRVEHQEVSSHLSKIAKKTVGGTVSAGAINKAKAKAAKKAAQKKTDHVAGQIGTTTVFNDVARDHGKYDTHNLDSSFYNSAERTVNYFKAKAHKTGSKTP